MILFLTGCVPEWHERKVLRASNGTRVKGNTLEKVTCEWRLKSK